MSINNSVVIVGNLTRDPEILYMEDGGRALCRLGVAETPRRRTEDGKWEDGTTNWFNAAVWGPMAENVAQLTKGMRVVIVGTVKYRTWQANGADGKPDPAPEAKRSGHEINVDELGVSLRFGAIDGFTKTTSNGNGDTIPPPVEDDI